MYIIKFSAHEQFLISGLFSKAIAHSGTNLAPWSQPAHKGVAIKRATQLAKYFDCYAPKWSQTIDCLREIPAKDITAAFYDFFVNTNNEFPNNRTLLFNFVSSSLIRNLTRIRW